MSFNPTSTLKGAMVKTAIIHKTGDPLVLGERTHIQAICNINSNCVPIVEDWDTVTCKRCLKKKREQRRETNES